MASSSSASSSKPNVPKRIAITRRRMAEPDASKNSKKRRITKTEATCSYLPYELWEKIFKSLNGDRLTLKSLSVISKQFLSITNRFQSSLKITDEAIPYLPRLFHRFPNLTSVDLTGLSQARDLGAILTQISTFSFDLHALSCNSFAANGLLALSKTMKNLTSFSFTPLFPYTRRRGNIKKNDILFAIDCFPSLENIILTYYTTVSSYQLLKFGFVRSRINGRFLWKYTFL